MLTVKQLRIELAKFRDDALCYAYEGEVTGVIVNPPGNPLVYGDQQGVIYCSDDEKEEKPTFVPLAVAASSASDVK